MRKYFLVLIVLLLAGCATQKESYVVLMPNEDGTSGKIIVSNKKNEQVTVDQVGFGADFEAKKWKPRLLTLKR